jgi:hypothetical protein
MVVPARAVVDVVARWDLVDLPLCSPLLAHVSLVDGLRCGGWKLRFFRACARSNFVRSGWTRAMGRSAAVDWR